MTLVIPPGIFADIISFFGGAWGKLAIYALIIGSLAFGFRIWLNKHDDRIFNDGKDRAVKLLETQYVADWKKALAEAKSISDVAARDKAIAETLYRKIDQNFNIIFNRLDTIGTEVKKRDIVYVQKTDSIPASELDGALRTLSNAIAAQWPVR